MDVLRKWAFLLPPTPLFNVVPMYLNKNKTKQKTNKYYSTEINKPHSRNTANSYHRKTSGTLKKCKILNGGKKGKYGQYLVFKGQLEFRKTHFFPFNKVRTRRKPP